MARSISRPRRAYFSHMSASVQRRITDVTYRLRPEQPAEGLQYISMASEGRNAFFSKGQLLEIVVWNTFKGKRERYYDFLAQQTAGADLILLQEFRHDPLRSRLEIIEVEKALQVARHRAHGSGHGRRGRRERSGLVEHVVVFRCRRGEGVSAGAAGVPTC